MDMSPNAKSVDPNEEGGVIYTPPKSDRKGSLVIDLIADIPTDALGYISA